ncbi:MAG: TatD family hydrolase [Chitinophagaceae bacterium]
MMLIDTHSHIYLPEFVEDRAQMFERAAKIGIRRIIMPAIDSSTHPEMISLEEGNSSVCLSMMGLHPCSVKENYVDELKIARNYFEKRPFVAVGEVGLDFYWDKTFTEQQYHAFHEQIEWALHYHIPVVIHSRNSVDECIKVISDHQKGKLKGIFHCFSGTAGQAQQIIDLGFYLGIGGVVTFKNSGLDNVMNDINMDHIVLETDAPYLAPAPFRGKRNEPAYLKYVVKKLTEIKKISEEEIISTTTTNAKKLFKL